MFKLKSGETLDQHLKVDQAPYIHNFVKQSEFIQPLPQKTYANAVKFGSKK